MSTNKIKKLVQDGTLEIIEGRFCLPHPWEYEGDIYEEWDYRARKLQAKTGVETISWPIREATPEDQKLFQG